MAALLAVATALAYGRTLGDPLVADDWLLLGDVSRGFGAVVTPNLDRGAGAFHFLPMHELVLWVVLRIGGLSPVAFHAAALILGWGCAVAVCALSWQLTGQLRVGALAGALFVAWGTTYVPFVWAGPGPAYTVSILIYVGGLMAFVRCQRPGLDAPERRSAYTLFVAALVLAPLAHEQGVTLIGACALYWLFVVEPRLAAAGDSVARRVRSFVVAFALPAVLVLGYLVATFTVLGLGEREVRAGAFSVTTLGERLGLGLMRALIPGLSVQQALDVDAGIEALVAPFLGLAPLVAAIVLLAVTLGPLVLVARFGSGLVRFLVAWLVLLVAAIVTIVNGPAPSRHLLLMTVPACILWSVAAWSLSSWAASIAGRARPLPAPLRALPALVVACLLAIPGLRFGREHVSAWSTEVAEVAAVMEATDAIVGGVTGGNELTLVDYPTQRRLPSGEIVPLFRVYSLDPWIGLRYPGAFATVQPAYTAVDPAEFPRLSQRAAAREFLWAAELPAVADDPSDLRLAYAWPGGEVVPWTPPPDLDALPAAQDGTLAAIDGAVSAGANNPQTIRVRADGILTLEGWAIDRAAGQPAGGVFLLIDGIAPIWAKYGAPRPDVAARLDDPALLASGFRVTAPPGMLPPGRHRLELAVVAADGRSVYRVPVEQVLDVRQTNPEPAATTPDRPRSGRAATPAARPNADGASRRDRERAPNARERHRARDGRERNRRREERQRDRTSEERPSREARPRERAGATPTISE